MINLTAIRRESGSQAYTRGNTIYKHGMVRNLRIDREGKITEAYAEVEGSCDNEYQVYVAYNEMLEEFQEYECECPAYETYDGMCKHCVAVALELLEWYQKKSGPATQPDKAVKVRKRPTDNGITQLIYKNSIQEKARYFQPDQAGRVELVPLVHVDYHHWRVEFKIGAEQKYVLKDISRFTEAVREHAWVEYGKKLAFFHDRSIFTEESRKLVDFLMACMEEEKNFVLEHFSYSYQQYDIRTGRYLSLTAGKMVEFAKAVCGRTLTVDMQENYRRPGRPAEIHVIREDPVLTVDVREQPDGGCTMKIPAACVFQGKRQMCLRMGSYLYLCSEAFTEQMGEFCALMAPESEKNCYINEEDLPVFCSAVLPELDACTILRKPESLKKYEPQPCRIQIYLDLLNENLTARPMACYGDISYNLTESIQIKDMHRDIQKEQAAMHLATGYFPGVDEKRHLLYIPSEADEKIYQALSTGIEQLSKVGEVFISDALKKMQILRAPKISVGVSLKAGLLDIVLQSERLPVGELEALLSSYRLRRKYYRLKNGDFIELADNSLSAVAELAEGLEVDAAGLEEGRIRVPEYRAFYLDQVLRENEEGIAVKRNQEFKAFLRSMKNVEDSDFEEPSGLAAELRPYQKYGYRWLMTLDQLGFGGILADDMGLGKTVQAVAFLLAKKEKTAAAADSSSGYRSLIVCPASLVYNWESEIRRFAPSMNTVTVTGSMTERKEKIKAVSGDIFLTSYDLLKRDIEEYEGQYFDCMMLDEAQNIKNHMTLAAKAVKSVECGRRFALTGTPIENSLSELWSIFDFLMPGILGSYKKFKDNYEQPIVMKHDEVESARLKKMVRPFILRRLKKDVLKELPDKTEEVVYSRMEKEQRELYEANAQRVLDSLAGQTPEEFKSGKLQVLAELTRLRQICCDPSLAYDNYTGGSAKLETCMELIKNASEAGNKMLVFSQFTTMLDILKKRLGKEKIGYFILTGSTSKEKRMELVNTFNSDDTPVFLISLKAGGTGLNLTAASLVIHFDPWWNMAAQNQATDRAHRIGQRQAVTVYKLIMKDTLEEKILKLQEQKANLSDEIMSEGSISAAVGTKEEFMEILESGIDGK